MLLKLKCRPCQPLAQGDSCWCTMVADAPGFLVATYTHYRMLQVRKVCRENFPAILEYGTKYLIFRFVCFHRCDSLSHLMYICSFVIRNALSILFTAFTASASISSRLLTTSIERYGSDNLNILVFSSLI